MRLWCSIHVSGSSMGKKLTPQLVDAFVRLVPKLGEREAAISLGGSRSGFRAALHKRDHAPARKDRRGNKKIFTKAWSKKIHAFKEKVKLQGGNPTAKFVQRKLKIDFASVRSIQRELGREGDRYINRNSGKILSQTDMEARVEHCKRRLRMIAAGTFVYKGPRSARGAMRGIDCWMDCHSVNMPLEKAPKRSKKSWLKPSDKNKPHCQGQTKKTNIITPQCKLFGGCFPRTGKQFLCSYTDRTFTTEVCLEFFKRVVTPALRRNAGPGPWRIVCDGDGAFKSTAFEQYCEEVGIIKVPHPASSPELNPEENVWSEGGRIIEAAVFETPKWRKGVPGTGKQIKQADKDAWDKFVKEQYRKVSVRFVLNSTSQREMEERISQVIAWNGERLPKK